MNKTSWCAPREGATTRDILTILRTMEKTTLVFEAINHMTKYDGITNLIINNTPFPTFNAMDIKRISCCHIALKKFAVI